MHGVKEKRQLKSQFDTEKMKTPRSLQMDHKHKLEQIQFTILNHQFLHETGLLFLRTAEGLLGLAVGWTRSVH